MPSVRGTGQSEATRSSSSTESSCGQICGRTRTQRKAPRQFRSCRHPSRLGNARAHVRRRAEARPDTERRRPAQQTEECISARLRTRGLKRKGSRA
eukprot:3552017-Pleurochrysis_carterae.AAC.2